MELNKKNIRILLGIITFTVLLTTICMNLSVVFKAAVTVGGVMIPFIIGGCMAFILNVPMTSLENIILKNIKNESFKRALAVIMTITLVLLVLLLVVSLVIPRITESIAALIQQIPAATQTMVEWFENAAKDNQEIDDIFSSLSLNIEELASNLMNVSKNGISDVLASAVTIMSGTISGIVNSLIGFVFSIYLLLQKERLIRQGKQVLYAFMTNDMADRIIYICRFSSQTFQNFITGQCLEALILGSMFFAGMLIFRMPYALMISVLIAITSLIPVFGAFIGCVVGAFLILFVNPLQALWFIILFFVLQQIEGNLIYPHVVGNSVGLPSIWVLAAVIVGGNLMGVVGMLIFIPLCSVLYTLFREKVLKRLEKKKMCV